MFGSVISERGRHPAIVTLNKVATKVARKVTTLLFSAAMLPVAIVMRILAPFFPIKVGGLRSNIIGHYVFDAEYYLSAKEAGKTKGWGLFFYTHDAVVNEQWGKMVSRMVSVKKLYRYIFLATYLVPGGAVNRISFAEGSRDRVGLLKQTNCHFSFTADEQQVGLEFIKGLGIGPLEKFVCLIVRDSAYKPQRNLILRENKDWSYHDFRNSDIEDYSEAIQELVESGFWVFRMGKHMENPLAFEHPRVFDYANSVLQTDFLDIWLMANCSFCVSTCTGLDEVTRAFRRPAVYVNFLPIQNIVSYSPCVNAPKRLYWIESGRELTLSEHLDARYMASRKYEEAGIVIKDLSPDEIRFAVREMILRERGLWVDDQGKIDRQRQFWRIMRSHTEWGAFHGVVDPNVYVNDCFIRKDAKWLQ